MTTYLTTVLNYFRHHVKLFKALHFVCDPVNTEQTAVQIEYEIRGPTVNVGDVSTYEFVPSRVQNSVSLWQFE
jgi:hypothetical protein